MEIGFAIDNTQPFIAASKAVMSEEAELETLAKIARNYPITQLMYRIENEDKRHPLHGIKFKNYGIQRGIPSICLPYPASGYHALYLKMKRRDKKYNLTPDQVLWIHNLRAAGNYANVAYGYEDAWKQIMKYLNNNIDKQ